MSLGSVLQSGARWLGETIGGAADGFAQGAAPPVPELQDLTLSGPQAGQVFDPGSFNQVAGGYYQRPGTWRSVVGQTPGMNPGEYAGAGASASWAKGVMGGLGMAPTDTSQAIRDAAFAQLARGGHEAAVQSAQQAQAMGMGGSGTQLALAQRRATDMAGQGAMAEMAAQQDAANRQLAYDQIGAGLAGQFAEQSSDFALGKAGLAQQLAGQKADYALGRAGLGAQMAGTSADYALGRAGQRTQGSLAQAQMLNDARFRNEMAQYEANVLMPAAMQMQARGQGAELMGGILGGLGSLGGAVLGGRGGGGGRYYKAPYAGG